MANKKTNKISLPRNRNKILVIATILLVSVVGTFLVYRSQAATHVVTIVAKDQATTLDGYGSTVKLFTIPAGKGTLPGLWVKKGKGVGLSHQASYAKGATYQACFALYNTKDNKVRLKVTGWNGTGYNSDIVDLSERIISIAGQKNKTQSHCVKFKPDQPYSRVMLGYEPLGMNGVIHKVTVIKH